MPKHILITGGAGFIGSHLSDALIAQGHTVRALDCLNEQVHGPGQQRPAYLHPDVELVVGDVRDRDAVRRALDGVDAVYHLAAAVGVGQSMYELAHYTSVNNLGTAVLLEALIAHPVERLVVASSMSLYGEGRYGGPDGAIYDSVERDLVRVRRGEWDPRSPAGDALAPLPTPESKTPALPSLYALSKYDQERMCLMVGEAYRIPAVALRFFNVYGTRQALSNPYTGVLAIFASRLLNGNRPMIFEDGRQQRDFVNVADIVQGCVRALDSERAVGHAINIGGGRATSILEVAERLAALLGRAELTAELPGSYRAGDTRHCIADITRARELLGYEPTVTLEAGMEELVAWLDGQAAEDRVNQASAELAARGLTT
jgi:dTDP-L-rhamnose 4-epimerase